MDNAGNRTAKTDNRANVTTNYGYDNIYQLLSATQGATTTESYTYDSVGNRLSNLTTSGCTLPTLTATNPIGRRTGMCDGAGSEAWAYDSMGRILFEKRISNSVTKQYAYTYNLDGSFATQALPSTSLTYSQGGAGRYVSLYNGTLGIAYNVKYTPSGALCFMNSAWGQAFTERYTFNNRLQPVAMQVYGTGYGTSPAPPPCAASLDTSGTQLNLSYNFVDASGHNNGNVASITNWVYTPRTQSFTYDSLNRLKTAQTTATHATDAGTCWGETYNYDPWGNLLKLGADTTNQSAYIGCTQESGFDFTFLINTNNRIATSGYAYDAAGNLTTSPGSGTVTFDAENHLIFAGGLSYAYDGDGNRIWKASGGVPSLIYWYGGTGILQEETSGTGATQYTHLYFNGRRIKRIEWTHGAWYDHYAYDFLGNTRWVYGYNGAWDVSDFYPFGGERPVYSAEGNKFKFTGKERDSESGLDNFGKRYFGSAMGRFMTPDPLLNSGQPWNPQSWNRYAYTENNPLRYTDPLGLYKFGNCSGTDEQCKADQQRFRDSIAKAKEALKGLDPNSKEAKQLQKTLDKLGEEGKGNIKINFGDAGKTDGQPNLGRTVGNSITINYDAVDSVKTGFNLNQSESEALDAGVTTHEGAHAGGGPSILGFVGMHGEHAAYFTESVTYQGLHNTDRPFLLWNESWLAVDQHTLNQNRENAIQNAIHPPKQPEQPKQDNPQ